MAPLSCVSSCPDMGYYPNSTTKKCTPCNSSCLACTSATACTLCYPPTSYLSGSNCVTKCPSGTFGNYQTTLCESCYMGCATCDGGATTDCLTCSSGYTFNSSLGTCSKTGGITCSGTNYIQGNSCVKSCSSGYYASTNDSGNKMCATCAATCKECTGGTTSDCTACWGQYLDPVLLLVKTSIETTG